MSIFVASALDPNSHQCVFWPNHELPKALPLLRSSSQTSRITDANHTGLHECFTFTFNLISAHSASLNSIGEIITPSPLFSFKAVDLTGKNTIVRCALKCRFAKNSLNRRLIFYKTVDGKLVERLNTPVLKTGIPSRGSRVRIPHFPPLTAFRSSPFHLKESK